MRFDCDWYCLSPWYFVSKCDHCFFILFWRRKKQKEGKMFQCIIQSKNGLIYNSSEMKNVFPGKQKNVQKLSSAKMDQQFFCDFCFESFIFLLLWNISLKIWFVKWSVIKCLFTWNMSLDKLGITILKNIGIWQLFIDRNVNVIIPFYIYINGGGYIMIIK